MSNKRTRLTRRTFIATGVSGTVMGTAGCSSVVDEFRSDSTTTTTTTTDQAASLPTKEQFRFEYDGSSKRVEITYLGGQHVVAGTLWIQTTGDGTKVNWPQLGSTASSTDEALESGATAVIGDGILNWPSTIERSETIRLIYQETDSPTTIAQFSPPEATTTVTTTVPPQESSGFFEGFEDGNDHGWTPVELTEGARDRNGNNWSLVENAINGNYSLHLRSVGDHSDNGLATKEYVVDMSKDFTLSFKWITPDPNNRGPGLRLLKRDGTNFEETPREDILALDAIGMDYGGDAISEDGSPFKGKASFSGTQFTRESYEPDTVHTVLIEKVGSRADLFFDGEHQQSATVRTNGQYRLALVNSGTWGNQSTIRFDDIELEYESTPDSPSRAINGFESNNGKLGSVWNIQQNNGKISVVEEPFDGAFGLRMPTGGNKLWQPLEGPIPNGTVFSAWAKTDRIGIRNHRVYQIGDGGGFGNGTYMSMRFRKGGVHINGDAITAKTLYSTPEKFTWYRFEMEVLGDGEVAFRLKNASNEILAHRTIDASNSSEYSRVELWTGDVSSESATVWFDNVRVRV